METLALIPARSGSKGVADKNVRPLAGKPLLAHSIAHALGSSLVNRTLVSTDSAKYAEIAKSHGAEVPFLRPPEIAGDLSTDLEVFAHALSWLRDNEGYEPDICLHLRPTYPFRRTKDVDSVIEILVQNPELDSVRTVVPSPETPLKMWFMEPDGCLRPVAQSDLHEPYNLPRQALPQVFLQDGAIDAVWTRVINDSRSMTGSNIYGYLMDRGHDIDTEEQFDSASDFARLSEVRDQLALTAKDRKATSSKTFCFDLDGVLATLAPQNDYRLAQAMSHNIELLNRLYDHGHRILIFTARGSLTGIDWTDVTKEQLSAWGVRFHELRFGKPAADYYIDDRLISITELMSITNADDLASGRMEGSVDERTV